MTKSIATIQKYMSTSPHSIGPDQPLSVAHRMMHEHKIRHLPVLHGGQLVGMLTERDVAMISALAGVDATKTTVDDAMAGSPYVVSPDAALDEVVAEMAERKYGSAIVASNGKVVGVFTTVDVCRAFSELLRGRLSK